MYFVPNEIPGTHYKGVLFEWLHFRVSSPDSKVIMLAEAGFWE